MEKKLKAVLNTVLVIFLILIFLAGCRKNQETIKIGVILPLSGSASDFGIGGLNGFNLALEEINNKGGVLGKKIEIIVRDDSNNENVAELAALDLIHNESVVAITGVPFTNIALTVAPICQESKIPMLTAVATNPEVTKVGDYIFRTCFNDNFQGYALALFAASDLKARSCAITFDINNKFASGLAQTIKSNFENLGGKVLLYEGHPENIKDFREIILHCMEVKPDVIFCTDLYEDAGLFCKQARELGFDGPIIGGDGWDSPEIIKIAGNSLNNTYYASHYYKFEDSPTTSSFLNNYKREFNSEPNVESALCYDSLWLLAEVIKEAGSTEPSKLIDAFHKVVYYGVTGKIEYVSDGEPRKNAFIIKFENMDTSLATVINPP